MDESQRQAWLDEILEQLLAQGARQVSLDQIGEAIGTRAVSTDDIDALIGALEARGVQVGGDEAGELPELLRQVLLAARQLQAAGQRPTPSLLADATGLSVRVVRVALLYAEVLRG